MKYPTSNWRSKSPYDAFLFASAGTDANGVEISTLSAFARLDLDPWAEAATLAHLPAPAAVDRLAALLASLPESGAHGDCRIVAGTLVDQLPSPAQAQRQAPMPRNASSPEPVTKTYSRPLVIIILVGLALGAQWLAAADRHPAETQTDGSHAFAFDLAPKPSPFTDKR